MQQMSGNIFLYSTASNKLLEIYFYIIYYMQDIFANLFLYFPIRNKYKEIFFYIF